jgi:PAS domain S-box-containing protein
VIVSGRAKNVSGQVEAALQASAPSGVLTALTQAPLGIAIFDREMRYLAASSQYLTDQGLPGDMQLVGRVHYDVFPEIPRRWRDIHARSLQDGVEMNHEADPYLRPDGSTEWIRWSLRPWRTEDGVIGGLVLYTEIVTPRVESRLRLEAAEARYRAVFDQAAMGVARVAPDGRFLEVNDRFCAITGYDRDEMLGLTFQEITHPDDLEPDLKQADALLAGAIETFSMEKRYLTKSGDPLWINLTASLIQKDNGEPDYFVSIVEDITYRKEGEAEQGRYHDHLRLLINELNHRVKNTLATVQSMAVQTLRGEVDLDVAYEKFEARLLGLSEVHDILTRERWHGAALQEVAERAMRPFFSGDADRVRFQGPEVRLQPAPALTLALVFHELSTNAVKYGALSVDGGRVDLTWSEESDDRLKLLWVESGGPPVATPTRKGFGTRLIERGLRGDLRGSATLIYNPGGLVCEMVAWLPRPADAPLNLFVEL